MSPRLPWHRLALSALPFFVTATAIADPLAAHHWKDRVLLVVADGANDRDLQDQRAIFKTMGAEARERDLSLVVVLNGSADAEMLRRRFGLGPGFHALLIGKDGGVKLAADKPLAPDALVPLIDAMPMRQEELKRRS